MWRFQGLQSVLGLCSLARSRLGKLHGAQAASGCLAARYARVRVWRCRPRLCSSSHSSAEALRRRACSTQALRALDADARGNCVQLGFNTGSLLNAYGAVGGSLGALVRACASPSRDSALLKRC
jgi:hypothetical protein